MRIYKTGILTALMLAAVFFKAGASDFSVFYRAGVGLIQNGEMETGRVQLRRVIDADNAPDTLKFKASFWSAHSFIEQDNPQEAVNIIREIFRIEEYESVEKEVMDELGGMRPAARLYRRAKRNFERAEDSVQDSRIRRARRHFENKRVFQAKETVLEILSEEPGNREAEKLAAEIDEIEKRMIGELTDIRIFLKLNDIRAARLSLNELLHLAVDWRYTQEMDELIKAEERNILSVYSEINRLMNLAITHYSQREYRKAETNLNRIFEFENDESIMQQIRLTERETEDEKAALKLDPELLFVSAAESMQKYDMNRAMDILENVLRYRETPDLIRYQSFFMQAFIHSFNDDRPAAERTFLSLMTSGLSRKYDIMVLPDYIAQNSTLLEIYNSTNERYESWPGISYENVMRLIERARSLAEEIRKINTVVIDARRDFIDRTYEYARSFYESGDLINAAQKAKLVIEQNPSNQMARYIYDTSLKRLSPFIHFTAHRENTIFYEAVENYLTGRYIPAIKQFNRIRGVAPDFIGSLIMLSRIQERQQKVRERARRFVTEAEKLAEQKYYSRAEMQALRALRLDENNIDAYVLLDEIRYLKSNKMER